MKKIDYVKPEVVIVPVVTEQLLDRGSTWEQLGKSNDTVIIEDDDEDDAVFEPIENKAMSFIPEKFTKVMDK